MKRLRTIILTAVVVAGLSIFGCGGDDDDDNPVNPGGGTPADVTINIVGQAGSSSYSPSPDTVSVGQTVAWHNIDSMPHTATADGGDFDTDAIGAGGTSAKVTMSTVGSFPYHCDLHSGMTGILVVE